MTPRFVVVIISGFCYFAAMGAMLPVIPRYVDKRLGGDDIAVGLAVGALAVGAILLRPLAGRVGDRFGRRVLMIGGALIVGSTALCAGVVESLGWLIGTRVLMGLGEAGFFVGALGFSMPAKVMQYRKMIEERASFADALERARAS